jgi:hypothetical protein
VQIERFRGLKPRGCDCWARSINWFSKAGKYQAKVTGGVLTEVTASVIVKRF